MTSHRARPPFSHFEERVGRDDMPPLDKACTAHIGCCLAQHRCAVAVLSASIDAMRDIVAVIRSWGLARQGIGGQPGVVQMSMPSLEGITCDEFSPTVSNEALHVISNEYISTFSNMGT